MEIINITKDHVFSEIKARPKDCNKGTFGRVLNLSGSTSYIGAGIISTRAAIRSGCGYVYIASVEEVINAVIPAVPEACCVKLKKNASGNISGDNIELLGGYINSMDSVLFGCGVGMSDDTSLILDALVRGCDKPLLIDADGLNLLSRDIDILAEKKCPVVLTPHPGEFARMTGLPVSRINSDRLNIANDFASRYGVTLLLKGSESIITKGDGDIFFVNNGSPGMAKAGSGDALSGMIASLLAQGHDPLNAACCGAWLHAEAGSTAAKKYSVMSMTASDLIASIGDVFLANDR